MRESDRDWCVQTMAEWQAWQWSVYGHVFVHTVRGMAQHGYIDAEIRGRQLSNLIALRNLAFLTV